MSIPAALAAVRRAVGPKARIHVIAHCFGALSFSMSLFGKAVTDVHSAILNGVALTPRVPAIAKLKLIARPFMSDYLLGVEYLNPWWRREPGWSPGKLLAWLYFARSRMRKINYKLIYIDYVLTYILKSANQTKRSIVSALHRECDSPECHMTSFMWGYGFPVLFKHENLHDITHRRTGDLFGSSSVNYYRHVLKMVNSGNTAVKYLPKDSRYQSLPDNYFDYAKDIETPVLFVAGQENALFTDSNIVCHQRLEQIVPGRHELHVFPGYGHADVIIGKNADKDVFPRFVEFLKRHQN